MRTVRCDPSLKQKDMNILGTLKKKQRRSKIES